MSTVTDDRDDKFAILLVVGKNPFESIGQAKELLSGSDLALQDPRLHLGRDGTTVNG